jgi:hypothetical protein
MPIDSVTLSDKRGPGERALTRRSVRQQLLDAIPLMAPRSGHSVAGQACCIPALLVRSGQQLAEVVGGPLGLGTWAIAGASS